MRTEMANRSIASGTMPCLLHCAGVPQAPAEAPQTTRRGFIAELKRELRPALQKLQRSNIAPVDLAQSAIGPGMGVYSRYGRVLEADGSAMTVRSALQIINQELDVYFNEQDGELDANSRFCVDLYTQNAFNNLKFGDADTLARAKNTSVAALAAKGVLSAEKGIVRLLTREELPEKVDLREESIWLLCQQLTRAMETGGVEACAQIVAPMLGSNAERAKDLCLPAVHPCRAQRLDAGGLRLQRPCGGMAGDPVPCRRAAAGNAGADLFLLMQYREERNNERELHQSTAGVPGCCHPLLAGYICQEMRREYQDNWWQEVLMTLSDQVRDLPDDNGDYAALMDSLDMANCLRLFDRKWNDLFKRKLSIDYRTWAKELMGGAQQAGAHRRHRFFGG